MPFLTHIVREVFWWIVDLIHEVFIGKFGRWTAWLITFGRWDVDDESREGLAIGWCVFAISIGSAAAWRWHG